MARRIVMGMMSNGSYDLRISRRGFDALTADVNNDRQISFSAQRAARAKVGAAGNVAGLNSWVNFGRTFDYPPPTLAAIKRGGRIYFNMYTYINPSDGSFFGSPFTLVVQANRCKAVNCIPWGGFNFAAGDNYQFYTLADD
jgi:hypothetical protein